VALILPLLLPLIQILILLLLLIMIWIHTKIVDLATLSQAMLDLAPVFTMILAEFLLRPIRFAWCIRN
jgi:hypothetical protein